MSLRVWTQSPTQLNNISYCRYLTTGDWFSDKFRAYNIVKAIKGDSFNGYSDLNVGSGWKRLTADRPEVAYEWFANAVATQTTFARDTLYCVCPIPDSNCTVDCGRAPKTLRLAEAISNKIPRIKILDVLRFVRPVPKSSQTNIRDENALLAAMTCLIPRVPNVHVIVLDDVCTSGAHARAAARKLMEHKADHISGMSVARTTHDATEAIFGLRIDSI